MPYLAVEQDVRIYYEDFGKGVPIVFTHAGSSTHAMWEHQVDKLARDFRTVTWDWRGAGLSDKPNSKYDIEVLVGDLIRLVNGLKLEKVILVGHGFGSHIAMLAAERVPHLLAGLTLVSTAPWCVGNFDGVEGGFSPEFRSWLRSRMGSAGISSPAAYAALFEEWLFKNPPLPVEVSAMVACAIQTPLYVMNSYRENFATVDHRSRASKITMPTLIMQGRHDRKQRYGGAVHLSKLIKGASLHTFENSAHMPQVEEMQEFNEILAAFAMKNGSKVEKVQRVVS